MPSRGSESDRTSRKSWELDPRGGGRGRASFQMTKTIGSRHLAKERRIFMRACVHFCTLCVCIHGYLRRPLARCLDPMVAFLLPNPPPPSPSPGVQLPALTGSSIGVGPLGRHLVAKFWCQVSFQMAKLRQHAPTWLQLGPTWPQLGPTWTQLGPTWLQLGSTWPYLAST